MEGTSTASLHARALRTWVEKGEGVFHAQSGVAVAAEKWETFLPFWRQSRRVVTREAVGKGSGSAIAFSGRQNCLYPSIGLITPIGKK